MSLDPEDLLAHSLALVLASDRSETRQTDLRRAVSAAYYSLFHFLLNATVRQLNVDDATREMVSRNYRHEELATVCKHFSARTKGTPPAGFKPLIDAAGPDLRKFADVFVRLEEARHDADYNPAGEYSSSETLELLLAADAVRIQLAGTLGRRDTQSFLACILISPDRFKPR